MNVERLHTISKAVVDDLTSVNLVSLLGNIVNSLQQVTSNQNNGTHQQQLATHLEKLRATCESSNINTFPPLWLQVLSELGIKGSVGNELFDTVKSLLDKNQITPTIALDEIRKIHTNLNVKFQAITTMVKSFETLELESDELEKGKSEIGLLIPRAYVDNDLKSLSKEFKEIQDILLVFEEIITGSRSSVKVNSISSSDFGIFVEMLPEISACLAISIERIVALYKNYLEIKKIKQDLEKKEVPEKTISALEEHCNNIVKKGILDVVEEIMREKCKVQEPGRRNELNTELNLSLNKLSNRIDRGFNLEVRYAPIEYEELSEDQELSKEEAVQRGKKEQVRQEILRASESLKFLKNSGEPILFLTEKLEDIKQTRKKTTKKKTTKKS